MYIKFSVRGALLYLVGDGRYEDQYHDEKIWCNEPVYQRRLLLWIVNVSSTYVVISFLSSCPYITELICT